MKKYDVELNFPLDPNVESGLYNDGIFLASGKYGDMEIMIETNLEPEKILKYANVDIKSILREIG